MRVSVFFAALVLLPSPAHADNRGPYVEASATALAGGGVEGLNVNAVGLELASGVRFARVFALEGLFDASFHTSPYLEPEEGAQCSGLYTDQWHWQTFGARLWTHFTDNVHIDFAIALPWVELGVVYDHGRSAVAPGEQCFYGPRDSSGTMIVVGLVALAFELRITSHVGLRLGTSVALDLGTNVGLGVMSVTGFVGPRIRF
jgi:hypothetical protein